MVGGKRDLPYAGTCTQSSSASFASSGVAMWPCRVVKSGHAKIEGDEEVLYENDLVFFFWWAPQLSQSPLGFPSVELCALPNG